MNKPKIFVVTKTPKALDNILSVQPESINQHYCAVINVADSPCATFDYQRAGIPSFWFPIHEIKKWGYSPFYGALKVVNEYYKGDKPILIHCHAGANRSPSVAYAILLAKGYTPKEAEESLEYEGLSEVFLRNTQRKHIPNNIVDFLKKIDSDKNFATISLHGVLANIDDEYEEWSKNKFSEQNDYLLEMDDGSLGRIIYDRDKKRFVLIKDAPKKEIKPWADPVFKRKEWYITPTVPE